jgi:hypothetical protein
MTNLSPTAVLCIAQRRQQELETGARIERALQADRAAARQEASRRTPDRDRLVRGKGAAAAPQRAGG